MKCYGKNKEIYQWLDGELERLGKASFEEHLKDCSLCQKEVAALRALQIKLQGSSFFVEPSADFETKFWRKIDLRRKESWFRRFLGNIESLFPISSFAQAFAIFLIALLIGGTGGVVSAMSATVTKDLEGARTSIKYLSGFSEFKGVPSPSMAGSYLKALEERIQG